MGPALTPRPVPRRATRRHACARARVAVAMGLLSLFAAATGCDRAQPSSSAPAVTTVRSLDVFTDGERLHRLTGHAVMPPEGERPRHLGLWYEQSDDGGRTWSPRVAVAPGHPVTPRATSRGEDAQIAARGDRLLAVWAGRGDGVWGSGPLGSAVSHDGGQTWAAAPAPAAEPPAPPGADDNAGRGVRFPALHASDRGFDLVWIEAAGDARSIHHTHTPAAGGAWSAPESLAPASCACCWNAVTTGPGGQPVAVYRNAQPRDMFARARRPDGTWTPPAAVGAFGWDFDGCPHVGAGLVFDREQGLLHAVVWTGQPDHPGVYTVRSNHGGRVWTPPRPLGSNQATHPDLVSIGPGRLVAAWTDFAPGGTEGFGGPELHWSHSDDAGQTWSAPQAVPGTQAGAAQGIADHVRLSHARGVVTAHWTQGPAEHPAALHSAVLIAP